MYISLKQDSYESIRHINLWRKRHLFKYIYQEQFHLSLTKNTFLQEMTLPCFQFCYSLLRDLQSALVYIQHFNDQACLVDITVRFINYYLALKINSQFNFIIQTLKITQIQIHSSSGHSPPPSFSLFLFSPLYTTYTVQVHSIWWFMIYLYCLLSYFHVFC